MLFANEQARGCEGGTGSQGGGTLRGGGSFVTKFPGRGAGLQPRLGGPGKRRFLMRRLRRREEAMMCLL